MVSIIMLSHNMGQYVEESVGSILAQTYTNWELLLVDDASDDDTIERLMALKDSLDKATAEKIKISQTVAERGDTFNRNSALKQANGRWMAFLDAGDTWAPEKLQRQIAFMEEHGYAMSYTMYGVMDMKSRDRGMVIGGKAHVTHQDMLKCCWPSYLGRVLLTNTRKWRYDAFRIDEDLKPLTAYLYTIRNGFYGMMKWLRYAKHS